VDRKCKFIVLDEMHPMEFAIEILLEKKQSLEKHSPLTRKIEDTIAYLEASKDFIKFL